MGLAWDCHGPHGPRCPRGRWYRPRARGWLPCQRPAATAAVTRLPSHLWCRALPLGLHRLQWVFDRHTHTPPLQGLACIPGRLLPGLHQVARGGTTPRGLWAANPQVNPALCDGLLGQCWYLWSEHVPVCVCVGGGGAAGGGGALRGAVVLSPSSGEGDMEVKQGKTKASPSLVAGI